MCVCVFVCVYSFIQTGGAARGEAPRRAGGAAGCDLRLRDWAAGGAAGRGGGCGGGGGGAGGGAARHCGVGGGRADKKGGGGATSIYLDLSFYLAGFGLTLNPDIYI